MNPRKPRLRRVDQVFPLWKHLMEKLRLAPRAADERVRRVPTDVDGPRDDARRSCVPVETTRR